MQLLEQLRSRTTVLVILLFLGAVVRLHGITSQPLDWHSFRQADTASVTREYIKHGISLLEPHYQDLSNIQSGEDNLNGYRMVEFPLLNASVAWIVRLVPSIDFVILSRLQSVLLSLGTLYCIYKLVEVYSGKRVAVVAAFLAAVLPYHVFYSRVIMPEPGVVFFSTAAILCFHYWLKHSTWYWYCAALGALTLAFLLKPFVVFLAPVFAVQVFFVWRELRRRWLLVLALPLLAVSPLLWWRQWIEQYPSGIPANDWLFNGDGIRFRPAWFRWLAYERIIKLMLGWVGALFLLTSLYKLTRKEVILYGAWWLGMLAYVSVIATGNVRHDYYQTLLAPILIITVSRGIVMAEQLLAHYIPKIFALLAVTLLTTVMLILAWMQVRGYYNINHREYITAGQAADRLLPPDAKVIAPAFGDTQFLFQTNRTGWPIGYEIEDKRELGAEYYVSTSYDDEARELEAKYFTIEKTPEYIILDLTRKLENTDS